MRFREQLRRCLPEIPNLRDDRFPRVPVRYLIDIHSTLICEIIKHIGSFHRGAASLLITEYEIDPLVKMSGNVIAFEGGTVLPDEIVR